MKHNSKALYFSYLENKHNLLMWCKTVNNREMGQEMKVTGNIKLMKIECHSLKNKVVQGRLRFDIGCWVTHLSGKWRE
jgi:hypothetical protein